MKKHLIVILSVFFLHSARAQTSSQLLSQRIAERMKDSLQLSEQQTNKVYFINMDLMNAKQEARQTFYGSDSLSVKVQQIENRRDSLYSQVLNADQMLLYRRKKTVLVNNNPAQ